MIVFLRILFAAVVVTMLGLIAWASLDTPLFEIPGAVIGHPWFVTTLFDAYFAFLAFFVWVAWKERRAFAGGLWFVSIMLLGNVAIGAYMVRELFRVPARTSLTDVMTRRNEGSLVFPGFLVVMAVVLYLLG